MKDVNTALKVKVKRLIKSETVSVPSNETNKECIVKLEGLLTEKTSESKQFELTCGETEEKL